MNVLVFTNYPSRSHDKGNPAARRGRKAYGSPPGDGRAAERSASRIEHTFLETETPNPTPVVLGDNVLTVTNPGEKALTISEVKVIDSDGSVVSTRPLVDGPVTIAPGAEAPVTFRLNANDLLDADGLRLIDERGVPITVVDENGVTVGDIDVL